VSYGLLILTTDLLYCYLSSNLWAYIFLKAAAALIPLGGSAFMADIDIIDSFSPVGELISSFTVF
jgi:hypothetical protein